MPPGPPRPGAPSPEVRCRVMARLPRIADQAKGRMTQAKGDVKDKADDISDRVGDKVDDMRRDMHQP